MPGNARRGRPQGQCHRKHTAEPGGATRRAARVKRCGKSAPRRRQRGRHGKPHREQDQVGAAGAAGPDPFRSGDAGRAFAPPLGSVTRGARRRTSEDWPSPARGQPRPPARRYRTRLTRRLASSPVRVCVLVPLLLLPQFLRAASRLSANDGPIRSESARLGRGGDAPRVIASEGRRDTDGGGEFRLTLPPNSGLTSWVVLPETASTAVRQAM